MDHDMVLPESTRERLEPASARRDFRAGQWLVSPKLNRLRWNGRTIHLEPKVMQVLLCLADHPGDVVSKEELMQRVWADTFVTDDVLKRCISDLRKAVGDDHASSAFIETIPKVGYRLAAIVGPEDSETPNPRSLNLTHRSRWLQFAIGALVLVIAAAGAAVWVRSPRTTKPLVLAVLPFENLSGDPKQEAFSDGLTEEMISEAGRLSPSQVAVIARESVIRYKRSAKPIDQIGRELGADYVLESSVRQDGGRVRVTARLVNVRTQAQLWSHSYEQHVTDILLVQIDIAAEIGRGLSLELARRGTVRQATPSL